MAQQHASRYGLGGTVRAAALAGLFALAVASPATAFATETEGPAAAPAASQQATTQATVPSEQPAAAPAQAKAATGTVAYVVDANGAKREYSSLKEALESAKAGETVKAEAGAALEDDVTIKANGVTFDISGNIAAGQYGDNIETNNHTITVNKGAKLTFKSDTPTISGYSGNGLVNSQVPKSADALNPIFKVEDGGSLDMDGKVSAPARAIDSAGTVDLGGWVGGIWSSPDDEGLSAVDGAAMVSIHGSNAKLDLTGTVHSLGYGSSESQVHGKATYGVSVFDGATLSCTKQYYSPMWGSIESGYAAILVGKSSSGHPVKIELKGAVDQSTGEKVSFSLVSGVTGTVSAPDRSRDAIISLGGPAEVTVENGDFQASGDATDVFSFPFADSGAKVEVSDGTFTAGSQGAIIATGDAQSGQEAGGNSIAINGGTFSGALSNFAEGQKLSQFVHAGTFDHHVDRDAMADDYRYAVTVTIDGKSTSYEDLSKAVDAVNASSTRAILTFKRHGIVANESTQALRFTKPVDVRAEKNGFSQGALEFAPGSDGSTVKGVSFILNPRKGKVTAIHVAGASNITIGGEGKDEGNSFSGPRDPKLGSDVSGEREAVLIDSGSSNINVNGNTFAFQPASYEYWGKVSDRAVVLTGAVNMVRVQNNIASFNGSGDGSAFLWAQGTSQSAGAYGVKSVTVRGNNAKAVDAFAAISGVDGIRFQENSIGADDGTVDGYYSGYVVQAKSGSDLNNSTGVVVADDASKIRSKYDKYTLVNIQVADPFNTDDIRYEGNFYLEARLPGVSNGVRDPAPTSTGLAFAGWYKDKEFKQPYDATQSYVPGYAKFVPVGDVLKFRGGSLRMDYTAGDYSQTSIRFGYRVTVPEGAKYLKDKSGWKASGSDAKDLNVDVPVTNAADLGNNTYATNLVFTGEKSESYKLPYYVQAYVGYQTQDGTIVTLNDAVRTRSVQSVTEEILKGGSGATQAERDYATGIQGAITKASAAASN